MTTFVLGLVLGLLVAVIVGKWCWSAAADCGGVHNTQGRMAAEHALAMEKKAHDETTRAFERQRLICNNCRNCNPDGGA